PAPDRSRRGRRLRPPPVSAGRKPCSRRAVAATVRHSSTRLLSSDRHSGVIRTSRKGRFLPLQLHVIVRHAAARAQLGAVALVGLLGVGGVVVTRRSDPVSAAARKCLNCSCCRRLLDPSPEPGQGEAPGSPRSPFSRAVATPRQVSPLAPST